MKIAIVFFLSLLAGCGQLQTKHSSSYQDVKVHPVTHGAALHEPGNVIMFEPSTDNSYVISCAPRTSTDPYNTARIRANAYFLEKLNGSELRVERNEQSRVSHDGKVKQEYSSRIQSQANGVAHSQVEKHWTEGGILCLKVTNLIHRE